MHDAGLEQLRVFAERSGGPSRSLVVLNSSEPAPLPRLLEQAFEAQNVTVEVTRDVEEVTDLVVLVVDGEVVASSSLDELMDAYLLVNSDLYRTGTSGIDKYAAPEVLTGLHDTSFRLRGFPHSNKEKLLLVLISRHIESLALDAGDGTLRSSFQRLSRLDDERGTREVYERLGDTDVDTHVYGVPDIDREMLPDAVDVHGGRTPVHRDSWFVVFDSPNGEGEPAALVAIEEAENEWLGRWTFDAEQVAEVADVVADI
ncbi:DICT sensory domain-containing protein [Halorarius halobius]|uniref:DICT sensory domain-containing protein n=1 Tax=Halorarius halobius TaxID=2962671 RepID=UPI0020CE2102|nr:DICT sensory domain-containing protein [Halorarius halobius]